MEDGLTFRKAHGGMTCEWAGHRMAVRIGNGGDAEAKALLIAWAREVGWDG